MKRGAAWRIIIMPAAERDLKAVPARDRERIRRALDVLVSDPFGADIKKLTGVEEEWRLRVGDWRVRFERDDPARVVVVLRIRRRKEAYRRG